MHAVNCGHGDAMTWWPSPATLRWWWWRTKRHKSECSYIRVDISVDNHFFWETRPSRRQRQFSEQHTDTRTHYITATQPYHYNQPSRPHSHASVMGKSQIISHILQIRNTEAFNLKSALPNPISNLKKSPKSQIFKHPNLNQCRHTYLCLHSQGVKT